MTSINNSNYKAIPKCITKELKTSRGHVMPRSSISVTDLPAMRTIPFLHGNGLACLRANPYLHRNGLARTESVLAYGHRGLPRASLPRASLPRQRGSLCRRADVGPGDIKTDIGRDTDTVKVKTLIPSCRLCCATCGDISIDKTQNLINVCLNFSIFLRHRHAYA